MMKTQLKGFSLIRPCTMTLGWYITRTAKTSNKFFILFQQEVGLFFYSPAFTIILYHTEKGKSNYAFDGKYFDTTRFICNRTTKIFICSKPFIYHVLQTFQIKKHFTVLTTGHQLCYNCIYERYEKGK